MTGAVVVSLAADGYRVRQVVPGTAVRQLAGDRFEADLSSAEALEQLHRLVAGPDATPIGAVINFLGLSRPFCRPGPEDAEGPVTVAAWTFQLAKGFAQDLRAGAGGWFVNLTALDGRFGLGGGAVSGSAVGGTLGVVKTLRREYPSLTVKAIDVAPDLAPDLLAARVLQELTAGDDLLEVGLTRQARWRLALKPEPVPHDLPPLALDAGSVVLVTGGASGVTSEVAKALAAARPRLILVGRSALPGPESPATRDLDKAALRQTFLEDARRTGATVLPAEIERRVNRVLKDRQILATLDACRAAGAAVEYHPADVSDAEQFGRLIDDLYDRFGRIDGVVHGAGVIEDRRIPDKTLESFTRVFRTKVDGALTLARKLRPEGLKFLVFFGSVAGRFGNAGQIDYSAANEALNKLADALSGRWPARVVCINWGPWDAGMVGDELRRVYAARGIELIPVAEGARAFLDELRAPGGPAEVVISGGVERMEQRSPRDPDRLARTSREGATAW
ncbi:MAG: SDR family NAD(P)-dependent oxidoreductase [Zavarzinella sp.]|nr:SDR family NAD(P)-dependent oxidoreductase [Zavarzinella sp.]